MLRGTAHLACIEFGGEPEQLKSMPTEAFSTCSSSPMYEPVATSDGTPAARGYTRSTPSARGERALSGPLGDASHVGDAARTGDVVLGEDAPSTCSVAVVLNRRRARHHLQPTRWKGAAASTWSVA